MSEVVRVTRIVLRATRGATARGVISGAWKEDERYLRLVERDAEVLVPMTRRLRAIHRRRGQYASVSFTEARDLSDGRTIWDVHVAIGKMPFGLAGTLRRQKRRIVR